MKNDKTALDAALTGADASAPGNLPPSLMDLADDARDRAAAGDASDLVLAALPDFADEADTDGAVDAEKGGADNILTPVEAIARAALDEALPDDVRARLAGGPAMTLVVAVPGADWVHDVKRALDGETSGHKAIARDGSDRKGHVPSKGGLDVGAALAGGLHAIGVSQAPASFLPEALLAAADATIAVRAPGGAALARALALTGRTPPPDIPDSLCAGMTLAEIFVAFRKDLDGPGVVDALTRMSARKAAVGADDGVPPLPALPGHSGEARAWGTRLIAEFVEWRDGRRAWRDVSASAVLAGPPGTGKTLFARSLAKGIAIPLLSTGVGDWFARTEGNLGDIARAFQDFWDGAMARRPCVAFIDELDAIPDRATLSNRGRDWWLPIVTLILTTVDGAQTARDGLVLIGATNHGAHLDAALIRRGRFDRLIHVGLPTSDDLAAIVAHHLGGALSAADLLPATRLARGASAADAAAWAREARSAALAEGRAVTVADVAAAVAPPDDRSPEALRRCAIHEAGHAVVALRLGVQVRSVSIVASGDSGGGTSTVQDVALATLADVDRVATISLGGRAAEIAVLGAPSWGAIGDLAKVSGLLAAAHATAGLGDSLLHRAATDADALLAADPALRRTVEAHAARLHADALAIVEADAGAVLRIADALVARRHLGADEVAALACGGAAPGGPR